MPSTNEDVKNVLLNCVILLTDDGSLVAHFGPHSMSTLGPEDKEKQIEIYFSTVQQSFLLEWFILVGSTSNSCCVSTDFSDLLTEG